MFVQPFPATGQKWQISNAGGVEPQWSGDGNELFYLAGSTLMSVELRAKGGVLQAGIPKPLFQALVGPLGPPRNRYLAAKDGRKFLIVEREETATPPFTVVTNWPGLLEHR